MSNSLHTYPCLLDRTNGRSPVREKYTYTPIPAYRTAQMADRQSGKNTHTHYTYTPIPAYRTAQMADRQSGKNTHTHLSLPTGPHKWQIAGQGKKIHTHLSLPTGPHKWQIAGQGKIHIHTYPCLPDRTNGRSPVRGKKYIHTYPCLLDRTNGRSPVREKYTYTPIPAYWTAQMADRRSGKNTHTHYTYTPIPAYRTAQMADRQSGKNTHTHLSLPTGPHKWQIAGQGKKIHTHLSLPTGPHKWQIAGQGKIHIHTYPCLPDRTNGRSPVRGKKYIHTYPCLLDRTNGRSPVREKYTYTPIPAYWTAQMADRRSGKNTHTHYTYTPIPAYRTAQMADRRLGKNTHTHLSLPTGPHKWQIAGQGKKIHTHLSLPTGPHKWQIAGQGKIHIHTYPCLPDRTNGRSPVRGKKYIHTYPCLLDRTNGRSPVREKYTYTPIPAYWTAQMADRRSGKNTHIHLSLPTGPHKWQIAGQGKKYIHTYPYLLDRTNGRSPVREKYTYTPIPAYWTAQMADRRSGKNTHSHLSLPTGPHKWQIAGQGKKIHTHLSLPTGPHKWQITGQGKKIHTHLSLPTGPHKWQIAGQGKIHIHTYPCLLDRTNGRSPVREKYTYTPIPAYRTAQMADRRSGKKIHTHLSLPTGPHKWQIAGQGKIHIHTYPCLLDRTNGRSPVREKYTFTPIPAYRTAQMADRRSGEKNTYTPIPAYWTAQMADHRSGKNTHTHLSLPTGPHKWQIAGQGKIHIHTYPCLPDRTNGRSPVREKNTYTPIPTYWTAQMADRRSGKNTHTHLSLPTGPHKWQIAGQGKIHIHTYPCLLDRTNGRSPVREKYTH